MNLRIFLIKRSKFLRMSLTKISPDQAAKYTIINSGYTARLVCYLRFVKYDIIDNKLVKSTDEHVCNDRCSSYHPDSPEDDDPVPLFIFDEIWGEDLYASPNVDLNKFEIDILKMMRLPESHGIVVFENTKGSRGFINFVKDFEFCRWFDVSNIDLYYDNQELFAICYNIDSESG